MRACAAIAALILALSGCGREAGTGHSTGGPAAKGDLNRPPIGGLRAAMPVKEDFPKAWKVQSQTSPPATLPGLSGADTGISSVDPARCLDFAAGFIAAPGSSVPGEFVSVITTRAPLGVITVLATRNTREWEGPAKVRDSPRDCFQVKAELSLGGTTSTAAFASSPIDTSAVRTDAAGRATVISAGDDSTAIAVVRAQVRGVLVAATANVSPGSGDDQRALLVKLVAQTTDKLNAL